MKELEIKAVIKDDGELTFSIERPGFGDSCSDYCEIVGILEQIKKCVLTDIDSEKITNREITDDR